MARDPYIPFDWPNLGSPLTPFIAIKFKGLNAFYYTFPDKTNNIYIDQATFTVQDENSYSTASITLVDPDFYNLETVFIKALYLANSLTRYQGNWYCAMFWGWSYYGQQVGEGDNAGQRKTSGIHYYMLRDLNYELTDVDLRVTFTLMDVGAGMFEGDEGITVGMLNTGNGVSHGSAGGATAAGGGGGNTTAEAEEGLVELFNAENANEGLVATGQGNDFQDVVVGDIEPRGGGPSATPGTSGGTQPEPSQNIITGKSYWEIIKLLCSAHNVLAVTRLNEGEVEPTDGPSPGEGGGIVTSQEYGRIVIPGDVLLSTAINDLKIRIRNQPVDAPDEQPTKRWDILAGGKLNPKPAGSNETDIDLPWGWVPQPPKGDYKLEDYYRLARTFTYRPGNKDEIGRGETMITSLNYDWQSKGGMLGLGLPPVYITAPNDVGDWTGFKTLDDFTSLNPAEVARIKSNPSVEPIPLADLVGKLGVELQFNFDTRTESTETIEIAANTIIVNVWNEFLNEIVTINITIPGDPWLDNQLYTSDGSDENGDLLVNLYESYFKVKVYKLSPGSYQGSSTFLSELLSGNYLCLHGCSHSITDGDYTTTLQLMKAP